MMKALVTGGAGFIGTHCERSKGSYANVIVQVL